MNTYFSSVVEALGWALIHCLWQGTVLALLLAISLRVMRRANAQLRYGAAALALAFMVAAFAATFVLCWPKTDAAPRPIAEVCRIVEPVEAEPLAASSAKPASDAANVATAVPAQPDEPTVITPVTAVNVPEAPASIVFIERFKAQFPWVVAIWAFGVLFFSARFLIGWVSVKRWVARAVPVDDADWKERFAEIAAALKVSRPVRFVVSAALTAPAVIGWLKPVVLVPAGIFTGLTVAQLEAILAHELAHIRRHDYLVNLLQNLVETLFFYHPAAWWISRQMRNERENCCDDLAAEMCGGALRYAKALTALEEMRGTAPPLAMAATGGSLLDRVRRLLGVKEQKSAAWPLGVLMIGIAAALFSLTVAKAVEPPDPTPRMADVNDGAYHSYCAYQNGEVRFVFLSKKEFTVSKGLDTESATLEFPKGRMATNHTINFAPVERGGELLLVSFPKANHHFHYDLTHSRVFCVEFDYHGFAPTIWQVPVKLEPITSPELLTKGSKEVATWLATTNSEQKWEYTRERVPEGNYKGGEPVDPKQAIIWGEPNEVGLRLGISGLTQGEKIQAGQQLPIKQYIRNDGKETLRFSPTGFFNEGIRGELVDAAGKTISLTRGYKALIGFARLKLEPGQFSALGSSPLQTILANKDGSPSTGLKPYSSGFVVAPGDYTLRLSHRVGQFEGNPVNANVGHPGCAPGLGEWRGVLQAAPISFRLSGPSIGTGKPGTVLEIEKTHRIQFQKGKLVLSHRDPNMTHTGTWAVSKDGNWPSAGGTWKIADPGGDYLAAWDEGGTRLWYVDRTGIQRLDIAKQFVDAGYWAMEEASDDLANMPDGVRKALNLPAKKETAPDPSAPVVRGVSLKNIPGTRDKANLHELFKADPANPGQFVQKSDVFAMPLYGEKDNPVLWVPKARRMFYIELNGATYGPITGNAAEDLALTDLVRRKLAETPNREGLLLLETMIKKGSQPIRECACRLVGELKEPEGPFDYDGIFGAAIRFMNEDDSGISFEANAALNELRSIRSAAHDKWEKTRVEMPDSAYLPGEKIADDNVLWGEADAQGMRLGISGMKSETSAEIGKSIPVEIYVRNEGAAPVKLSWCPRLKAGFRIWLVDETGKKHKGGYKFDDGAGYHRSRLEAGQSVKVASAEIEFFGSEAEIYSAPNEKGHEFNPRLGAPPGKYTLHADYRVGSADYAGLSVAGAGSEKVEWTNILSAKPVTVVVKKP